MINGYDMNKELECFFELPLGNNLTLSIYDSEEGYEIEVIDDIDGENEYVDCMIYLTDKYEKLSDLLTYAIHNTYSEDIKERIINKTGYIEDLSEEEYHKMDVIQKYNNWLNEEEKRDISYGEIAYIEGLDSSDLEELEKELDEELESYPMMEALVHE